MKSIGYRRPSPSLVLAFVALLIALGGTSYAAITLPQNSVGTKQLKKNAVTAAKIRSGAVNRSDIKKGAVNSDKVADGSLLAADFKSGQLHVGPPGPAGQPGAPGKDAFGTLTYVAGASTALAANDETYVEAVCPSGTVVTGGGILGPMGAPDPWINSSFPADDDLNGSPERWAGFVWNDTADDTLEANAWAICAKANAVNMPAAAAKALKANTQSR
jgi:hypothetical protein